MSQLIEANVIAFARTGLSLQHLVNALDQDGRSDALSIWRSRDGQSLAAVV